MSTVRPFSEDINIEFKEVELNLGSKDWQTIQKAIHKWKKEGGTLHAKLKGEGLDKNEMHDFARKIVEDRGSHLTDEEKNLVAWTPGLVPPWFDSTTDPEEYDFCATKAIEKLNVSAMDVHIAVEKSYTGKSLTPKQKRILEVGWNEKFGEFYHRDVGWY